MAYNRIPFKTSRAMAAFIRANVPQSLGLTEVYPHKSSGYRAFPNVTCLVAGFAEQQDNPGCWDVNIIVSIRTACPGEGTEYASEDLVGAIADLFSTAVGTDRSELADLITVAGRALSANAVDADMAEFKADSITPTQGATSAVEKDENAQCWVDDFPFALVVRAVTSTEP